MNFGYESFVPFEILEGIGYSELPLRKERVDMDLPPESGTGHSGLGSSHSPRCEEFENDMSEGPKHT